MGDLAKGALHYQSWHWVDVVSCPSSGLMMAHRSTLPSPHSNARFSSARTTLSNIHSKNSRGKKKVTHKNLNQKCTILQKYNKVNNVKTSSVSATKPGPLLTHSWVYRLQSPTTSDRISESLFIGVPAIERTLLYMFLYNTKYSHHK